MRVALAVAVPLGAALLQASLVPFISVGDVQPNLPLLVAASWAVAAGAAEACWWAFVGGIAADLLSGGPLGALAASALPAVAGAGVGERPLARPIPVIAGVAFVTIAAIVAGLLYTVILALTGQPISEPLRVVAATLAGALYTGALAVVAYPIARRLRRVTEPDSPF